MTKILIFVSAGLCYVSFIWASIFFFKVDNPSARKGKLLISILGTLTMLSHLWGINAAEDISTLQFSASFSLYISSIFLFWSTIQTVKKPLDFAFTKNDPTTFVRSGAFKIVRHPFYTSYTLAWLAGSCIAGQIAWLTSVMMFLLYFTAARSEEIKFLNSNHTDDYANYIKQTGMFFPNLRSVWK